MVKFSKQLEVQIVPEWKPAYCNYWQLKKILKQVMLHAKSPYSECSSSPRGILNSPFKTTFGGLARHLGSAWARNNDVIVVHQRNANEEIYETELFEPIVEAEHERNFFVQLDIELNKVNQFYKQKEHEFLKRGKALHKQMKAFKRMRSLLAHQTEKASVFQDPDASGAEEEEFLQKVDIPVAGFPVFCQELAQCQGNDEKVVLSTKDLETGQNCMKGINSIEVIGDTNSIPESNKVMIQIPLKPYAITRLPSILGCNSAQFLKVDATRKNDLTVNREQVHQAEKMLRKAYVEFYRGLSFLKSYSSLNMEAFAKILKKYEKVTGRNASLTYLRVVEQSCFNSSDKVEQLMDNVESLFAKHFTKNRREAMAYLWPTQQKASHHITFFLGLFTGCIMALFVVLSMIIRISERYMSAKGPENEQKTYIETTFPVFSVLCLILLHMYMYGLNVYAWRQVHINYAFIFEFKTRTELQCREILLVCTGLTTLAVGAMVIHLAAYMKENSNIYIDLIPLAILMVFFGILICPFKILYRSSRYFFLRCMLHIIFSPFYKVVLADFFLADQLTSQVPMLRNMEYVACYYIGGHFRSHNSYACTNNLHYKNLAYVISVMPYWFRLMQCFRRWIDEHDRAHVANGGKYLSAMVAVTVKLKYTKDQSVAWFVMLIITSTVATIYQSYWDLVIDWGLLQPYSVHKWLRDRLILKHKIVYFISMALNLVLRLAWLQSVTHVQFNDLNTQVTTLILSALEVIRRGQWNFYRIENEHLNNVGKYRAVKTLPLPFQDIEE
ncbi:hypothetical protein O6H91_03G108100 [Diphasiastrum complanatum]|uniref:Uncharacterized protein n=1 Tax=Diphasiastrum complanatum TaxID=34168 RepID=A0ACC2E9W0_DIPCM|nr:hypothetical protein O6H91_03G108100 [Diphasiastrum complanatum]